MEDTWDALNLAKDLMTSTFCVVVWSPALLDLPPLGKDFLLQIWDELINHLTIGDKPHWGMKIIISLYLTIPQRWIQNEDNLHHDGLVVHPTRSSLSTWWDDDLWWISKEIPVEFDRGGF